MVVMHYAVFLVFLVMVAITCREYLPLLFAVYVIKLLLFQIYTMLG